jgi:diguanylate cyclase (GGDEF)-like protein/PAS domain S-box-containing protein
MLLRLPENSRQRVDGILQKIDQIGDKRALIWAHTLDYDGMVSYYASISRGLLDTIYMLMTIPNSTEQNMLNIYQIQHFKELVGLEGLHIYKQLLSSDNGSHHMEKFRALAVKKRELAKRIKEDVSLKERILYSRIVSPKLEKRVAQLRRDFFRGRLKKGDVKRRFAVYTEYIGSLEKLSLTMVSSYQKSMEASRLEAKRLLCVALLLGGLSGLSLIVLFFVLRRLLSSEESLVEDLRIAAYSFEAHEAMTITDSEGVIIRVNRTFTQITGYEPEEVIGKNLRALKSQKHSDAFYQKMWKSIVEKGYWKGEILNKRKNGEIYSERLSITAIKDMQGKVTHYIAQFVDLTEIKEAEQEAIKQASHDFLTGLPNRKSLMSKLDEELTRSRRHHYYNAFLFIDVDDFKKVNDNYGHQTGDTLLQEISKRMKMHIREEDYLARLAGDEFSIVLLDLGEEQQQAIIDTQKICNKIIESVSAPYNIDGHRVSTGVSIGIKIFSGDADSVSELISHADTAMYHAKSEGKNRFFYYGTEIEEKMKEIVQLQREIEEGFDADQFVFYLQPKVAMESGQIVGAELLLRWQHPARGMLSPASFLYVARDMKVMAEITTEAIHAACRTLKSLEQSLLGTLSVNISAHELSRDGFVESVEKIVGSYGVDPASIELEIVEDELIRDFDAVIPNMERLQRFGIKFSIDDFGTGYSSISYLQKLPVDTIKIDKQFIQDVSDTKNRELTCMILDIAEKFGLTSIVEGVETKEQLEFSKLCGADQYQGFYFSKAVDEMSFLQMKNKEAVG